MLWMSEFIEKGLQRIINFLFFYGSVAGFVVFLQVMFCFICSFKLERGEVVNNASFAIINSKNKSLKKACVQQIFVMVESVIPG